MNIRLTISNFFARAAMLLLATVISIGAWAQHDLSDDVTTIEFEGGLFQLLNIMVLEFVKK